MGVCVNLTPLLHKVVKDNKHSAHRFALRSSHLLTGRVQAVPHQSLTSQQLTR